MEITRTTGGSTVSLSSAAGIKRKSPPVPVSAEDEEEESDDIDLDARPAQPKGKGAAAAGKSQRKRSLNADYGDLEGEESLLGAGGSSGAYVAHSSYVFRSLHRSLSLSLPIPHRYPLCFVSSLLLC